MSMHAPPVMRNDAHTRTLMSLCRSDDDDDSSCVLDQDNAVSKASANLSKINTLVLSYLVMHFAGITLAVLVSKKRRGSIEIFSTR